MISEAMALAFSSESRSPVALWCVVFVVGSALACPRTIQASRSVAFRYLGLRGPLTQLDLERSPHPRESGTDRFLLDCRDGYYSALPLLTYETSTRTVL